MLFMYWSSDVCSSDLLAEQPVDGRHRHVPAHHVAVDLREVAALEVVRNARGAAHLGEVVRRLHRDAEAVVAQVVGVAVAALAAWILEQGEVAALRRRLGEGEAGAGSDAGGGQGG